MHQLWYPQCLLLVCFFYLTPSSARTAPTALAMVDTLQSKPAEPLPNLTTAALRARTPEPEFVDYYEFVTDAHLTSINHLLVIFVILQVYAAVGEILVCREYLLPSVLVIADTLKLSQEVVGGTFLAFGVSAPLLLFNLGKLPNSTLSPWPNLYLTLTLSCCCFFKKRIDSLVVSWWTFCRNSAFYCLMTAVTYLMIFRWSMSWYQPSVMLCLFFSYCIYMYFDDKLSGRLLKPPGDGVQVPDEETALNVRDPRISGSIPIDDEIPPPKYSSTMFPTEARCQPDSGRQDSPPPKYSSQTIEPVYEDPPIYPRQDNGATTALISASTSSQRRTAQMPPLTTPEDAPLNMKWPETWPQRFKYILLAPVLFPVWFTLPDVRNKEKRRWVVCGYLGSILWLLVFHFFLVGLVDMEGMWPPAGIALLSTSLGIARSGLADMAISVIYGSGIIDLTIGFPLPCLVSYLLHGQVSVDNHVTSGASPLVIQVVIFLYLCCSQRRLNPGLGVLTLVHPFLITILLLLAFPDLVQYVIASQQANVAAGPGTLNWK